MGCTSSSDAFGLRPGTHASLTARDEDTRLEVLVYAPYDLPRTIADAVKNVAALADFND
jgi:hypothetical protein